MKIFKTIPDYVQFFGGKRPIERILIANNGIAAVKCIRSIRNWCFTYFDSDRMVKFLVMATPEDLKANAEYIRMADMVEEVPGGSNVNNYKNVELILDIATKRGVDAVWAGWGHASEDPALPTALANARIAFLGPPAKPMRDLGDKIASTLLAQSAGVSCISWSGSGLTLNYEKEGINQEVFNKACCWTGEEALEAAKKIGYPVMIKASEGGGGKGIRMVQSESQIADAFRQVQGEVGGPIFLMKMVSGCRHLEVQILGDQHGQCMALYGRDCSIQRRHQKIIEEGPPIACPKDTWKKMEDAAVRLAKLVGYEGVGTIEYLFDEKQNDYYFLELNPRLQVEHPVTELITDVNLPACQLQVAMGIRLDRIPYIRKFFLHDPLTDSQIDLSTAPRRDTIGHTIACRITGENPDEGFKPTSGAIQELTFRSAQNVWGYFSVGASGGIHEFADSQFGHVFASGATREQARREMIRGLRQMSIIGDISTTVAYLIYLLETEDYVNNRFSTQWLDALIREGPKRLIQNTWLIVISGVLFKAYSIFSKKESEYISYLQRGQVPPKDLVPANSPSNPTTIEVVFENVKYAVKVLQSGRDKFILWVNSLDKVVECEVRSLGDGGLLLLVDDTCHVCYGTENITGTKLILDGQAFMLAADYDPTQLRATTAGKLVRYLVDNNSHVTAGTAYAEIEVMKMYMQLTVTENGTIRMMQSPGNVIQVGSLLATLDLEDPSKVRRTEIFTGEVPEMKQAITKGVKLHQKLHDTLHSITNVLAGFYHPFPQQLADQLYDYLFDPTLPALEFGEAMKKISPRFPPKLAESIVNELEKITPITPLEGEERRAPTHKRQISFSPEQIGKRVAKLVSEYQSNLSSQAQSDFEQLTKPLKDICERYENGIEGNTAHVLGEIFDQFLKVEQNYHRTRDSFFRALRLKFADLKEIYTIDRAQNNLAVRSRLVTAILNKMPSSMIGSFTTTLNKFSELSTPEQTVSVTARQMLIKFQLPTFEQRKVAVEPDLSKGQIQILVDRSEAIVDLLTDFLSHTNDTIRVNALKVYLLRTYRAYEIIDLDVTTDKNGNLFSKWLFQTHWTDSDSVMMLRNSSVENLEELEKQAQLKRRGFFCFFKKFESLQSEFPALLEQLKKDVPSDSQRTALQIAIPEQKEFQFEQDEDAVKMFKENFLKKYVSQLKALGISRVTLVYVISRNFPRYYNFTRVSEYEEQTEYRNVEPSLGFHLELSRLSNYNITLVPTHNRKVHLYYAEEKNRKGGERFFARSMVRGRQLFNTTLSEYLTAEAEDVLLNACDAIELALADPRYARAWNSHIFLNFIPEVVFDTQNINQIIAKLALRYAERIGKLMIGEVEITGKVLPANTNSRESIPMRFITTNPTGQHFKMDAYREVRENNDMVLKTLLGSGTLEGKSISTPYHTSTPVEAKRLMCRAKQTTYAYDLMELFFEANRKIWKKHAIASLRAAGKPTSGWLDHIPPPSKIFAATELVLTADERGVQSTSRPAGQNDIGMIAWKCTVWTPECPNGREFIVISNDITFQIGSFGPREDLLFKNASALARQLGIPRIYLAANAGARIGLADEVKNRFQIAWKDPADPSQGFEYLYLTKADNTELLKTKSVMTEQVGEDVFKLTSVIGKEDGLGVENLKYAGLIAAETSQAYEEIFTITQVTAHTIGIGAYLVRLGQRMIQNRGPVILTGSGALNKVLGRNVYTSNDQLGGTQIMHHNGISHLTVESDLDGLMDILRWMAFVPKTRGAPVPILAPLDPIERLVAFTPSKTPYDPRHMLAGVQAGPEEWVSGFFDRDSFIETLADWGRTVVVGRARLGGIPMGVIAVETRTVEKVEPADPAMADSHENVTQQAGQVWFPDSAYKTAQAIRDFDKGEELPLIIFANWRGFSGGLRDLYCEILKFGSYIVDALNQYRQPVFVYIPPNGELRGGAWAVVDPTINPEKMEMYCAPNSRGGILEATGAAEVKFKPRDCLHVMHLRDKEIRDLDKQLQATTDKIERAEIDKKIKQREAKLLPVYEQAAIDFVDLHDSPGRMKAKGCISDIIDWANSREFFYWRLKRRLAEDYFWKEIKRVDASITLAHTRTILHSVWRDTISPSQLAQFLEDNKQVAQWFDNNQQALEQAKSKIVEAVASSKVVEIGQTSVDSLAKGINQLLANMDPKQRQEFLSKINKN